MIRGLFITLLVTALIGPRLVSAQTDHDQLYWTVGSSIRRANLDGSGMIEDLVTSDDGLVSPGGIAIDGGNGKLYWCDALAIKIQRANLDGSMVQNIVSVNLGAPLEIDRDLIHGMLYWADGGSQIQPTPPPTPIAPKIWRATLNGSNAEAIVTSDLGVPNGIAVDAAGGKVYWTDGGLRKIKRANLDGTGAEDLVTVGLQSPGPIVLDVAGGKMYWTDPQAKKIQRANLDEPRVVEDIVNTGLMSRPLGITLDLRTSPKMVYWTDHDTGKIQRASVEGPDFGVVHDVIMGQTNARGLSLLFALPTPTATVSNTPTSSVTRSASPTQSPTPTASVTSTATRTHTPTTTVTPTATFSASPSLTATGVPTSTFSATPTASFTVTSTNTATSTATATPTGSPTLTFSPSQTATPPGTPTPSETATATASTTSTPSMTPTATTEAVCTGDCDHSGRVTVDELVTGVNIALALSTVDQCPAFDADHSRLVTVDELVTGVNNALNGCGASSFR